MQKFLTRIIDSNWFFVSVVFFVIVLPFSQALISIGSGLMLFTALIEDKWENKAERFRRNRILVLIPLVFVIYLLSGLFSGNLHNSLYDIKKSLFFLVLPLAFLFGKEITSGQKRFVFYAFAISIFVSTLVAFINWKLSNSIDVFSVHKATLISHIRFSFQLILIIWFLILLVQKNYKRSNGWIILFSGFALYFLLFVFFQQSLTGLISLFTSTAFFILILIFNSFKKQRVYLFLLTAILISTPIIYINRVVSKFYDFEKTDRNKIDRKTKQGNLYWHDFENPMVENGKFVFLYVCEMELREEWNKRSEFKYDSIGINGFPVHSTLLRYVTSKGLRKDAEGIRSLTQKDIRNIENGIANVIFQTKKYSLYPRIYQTVWEYYVYSKTGYSNNQSFSQRIEYARAAVSIIKQNFWFGVGAGNWKEEFTEAFRTNNSKLSEEQYGSSHNQYLNYIVKFGVVGFVLIMFFLIFPVIKSKRYEDNLFLIFLVFMFFANFADSNLESHMGSSFFVFFYCIFMVGGKKYLQLNHDEVSHNRINL